VIGARDPRERIDSLFHSTIEPIVRCDACESIALLDSSLPRGSDQLELELGLSLNPSRSKTILLGTGFPFETEKERGCTQSNKLGHRAGLQLDDEDHCLHLRNRGQTTIELDFHWLVWRMRESYRSRQS